MPAVPPRREQSSPDYGLHILQAIMDIQVKVGDLSAKVDRLISDVRDHDGKIDKVRLRIMWVAGAAAALGFVGAALIAVLKEIPWSALAKS